MNSKTMFLNCIEPRYVAHRHTSFKPISWGGGGGLFSHSSWFLHSPLCYLWRFWTLEYIRQQRSSWLSRRRDMEKCISGIVSLAPLQFPSSTHLNGNWRTHKMGPMVNVSTKARPHSMEGSGVVVSHCGDLWRPRTQMKKKKKNYSFSFESDPLFGFIMFKVSLWVYWNGSFTHAIERWLSE